jgi:hypothetical protein
MLTGGRRTTDDGRKVMTIAHMARWAKKGKITIFTKIFELKYINYICVSEKNMIFMGVKYNFLLKRSNIYHHKKSIKLYMSNTNIKL